MIVAGDLRPGERIVESRIAREIGVGQPTVREGLVELEHQGLVSRKANQGCVVTNLTRNEIAQILRVRAELEILAVDLALESASDADIHNLVAITGDMKAAAMAPWLMAPAVKAQVTAMARQFMLGNDAREILSALRGLHDRQIAFTVDLLGEAVLSEGEAGQYAGRYLDMLALLAGEMPKWPGACKSNLRPDGPVPALNISVKISALYSQIHPVDPETTIEKISDRLRPILRKAKETGALGNFDMESYALKNLTLRLFKTIFSDPEFDKAPARGLAIQAYLKDSEADLADIIAWARSRRQRVTVRLVKGAYWDYETVAARQRGRGDAVEIGQQHRRQARRTMNAIREFGDHGSPPGEDRRPARAGNPRRLTGEVDCRI